MENSIKILIYIHAFFGGLGLTTGTLSLLVKKGAKAHKLFGKLFSIGMLTSSAISLPISWLPNHKNILLFLIGLFTIYLVISGNQILNFKSKDKKSVSTSDKLLSGSMFIASLFMLIIGIYGLINHNQKHILFTFFGIIGLTLTIKDFIFFKNFSNLENKYLSNHIGKMVGAFIASITAFIVAGIGMSNLISWTLPSVIGTIYIIYWRKKVKTIAFLN